MRRTLKIGSAEAVVDTMGGELISYMNHGREYVWTGDKEYWNGHAPVLFPFVSAIRNNEVSFQDRRYTIAVKHGFARKSEFQLEECTDSKAVFELKANDTTLKMYPYDFTLTAVHEITEDGFTTTYQVTNNGSGDMQFCIGGHPGFTVDGSAEDYILKFEKPEDLDLYYTDSQSLFSDTYKIGKRLTGTEFTIDYSDYDVDAIIARDTKSQKVRLVKKSDGTGIEFDYTGFANIALWTPPGKKAPFFCLEPWNGLPTFVGAGDDFEDKPYRIVLSAGKTYTVGYKVNVIYRL